MKKNGTRVKNAAETGQAASASWCTAGVSMRKGDWIDDEPVFLLAAYEDDEFFPGAPARGPGAFTLGPSPAAVFASLRFP